MFDSLYTFYNVWYVYNIILHIHGIYIAYNFFMWTMMTSYTYLAYMLTFFYIAQPVEQLENKKINEYRFLYIQLLDNKYQVRQKLMPILIQLSLQN